MSRSRHDIERLACLVEEAAQNFRPIFEALGNGKNAPGHHHRVRGMQDRQWGDKSDKPCEWCAQWERAKFTMAKLEEFNVGGATE